MYRVALIVVIVCVCVVATLGAMDLSSQGPLIQSSGCCSNTQHAPGHKPTKPISWWIASARTTFAEKVIVYIYVLSVTTAKLHTHLHRAWQRTLLQQATQPPGLHLDWNELPSSCSSLVWIYCSRVISAEGFHLRSPVIKCQQMDALSMHCCRFVRHVPCTINNLGHDPDFYLPPSTCFRDGVAPFTITMATKSQQLLSLSEHLHTIARFFKRLSVDVFVCYVFMYAVSCERTHCLSSNFWPSGDSPVETESLWMSVWRSSA